MVFLAPLHATITRFDGAKVISQGAAIVYETRKRTMIVSANKTYRS